MASTRYIKISTDNLKYNIDKIRNNFNYKYLVMDVSNNAFNHGMYIINFLVGIDFLYVNNFNDLLLVRKYNKDIRVIYNGEVSNDNIFDLIMNDAIVVLKNGDVLKNVSIHDKLQVMLSIDVKGYNGFRKRQEVMEVTRLVNTNKNIDILGVIASIKEKDYDKFKEIISTIREPQVMMLNNEEDTNKIKLSNAIKLDKSIYGINSEKKKIFQKKNEVLYKQVLQLKAQIVEIKNESEKKKVSLVGVIRIGYLNGMSEKIKQVFIAGKFYKVKEVLSEITLIEIDKNVSLYETVEIVGSNNPLEQYIGENTLMYFSMFSTLSIVYKNYVLEKTFVY